MEDKYSVKKKNAQGKFWSFGNVKKNQYGNYQLGLKVTTELRALVESSKEGEWLNFSLFKDEDERKEPAAVAEGSAAPASDGQEIPF